MAETKPSIWRAHHRKAMLASKKAFVSGSKTDLAAARAARIKAARKAAESSTKPSVWIHPINAPKSGRKLRFGAVVVSNIAPDAETVAGNVNAGREALKRATDILTKPGVTLRLGAHVPRFRVDVAEPGMLIRELHGVEQRGRIVNGAFVPAD